MYRRRSDLDLVTSLTFPCSCRPYASSVGAVSVTVFPASANALPSPPRKHVLPVDTSSMINGIAQLSPPTLPRACIPTNTIELNDAVARRCSRQRTCCVLRRGNSPMTAEVHRSPKKRSVDRPPSHTLRCIVPLTSFVDNTSPVVPSDTAAMSRRCINELSMQQPASCDVAVVDHRDGG